MNVLDRIFARKREEVEAAQAKVSLADLRRMVQDAPRQVGFKEALLNSPKELGLIAEVKKASPSKGLIRSNFDPVQIALSYQSAGASCLSVLTDRDYFQGDPEYLTAAKKATGLPCLRKDFVYDAYQIYEARAWGADCILLIVAGLEKAQIKDLTAVSSELGMDTLVEVHDRAEAEIAIELGCDLVGVNNRNLRDFRTDLAVSEELLPMLMEGLPEAVLVSESALETVNDLKRVKQAGARAVLIGTAFCASADIEVKVREVMGW